jgi:hypothetical protein
LKKSLSIRSAWAPSCSRIHIMPRRVISAGDDNAEESNILADGGDPVTCRSSSCTAG